MVHVRRGDGQVLGLAPFLELVSYPSLGGLEFWAVKLRKLEQALAAQAVSK